MPLSTTVPLVTSGTAISPAAVERDQRHAELVGAADPPEQGRAEGEHDGERCAVEVGQAVGVAARIP